MKTRVHSSAAERSYHTREADGSIPSGLTQKKQMNFLLLATLATIIPGQVIRINLAENAAATLTDFAVLLTFLTFAFKRLFFDKSVYIPKPLLFLVFFTIASITSLIGALNFLSFREVAVSSMFLVRFTGYASLMVIFVNEIKKNQIDNWIRAFLTFGFIFAVIGFLQFLFLPDLTKLQLPGWDPHIWRLFSTTFDPNYTGGILVILTSFASSIYLFSKKKFYLYLALIFVFCTLLTFSRSSYLALLSAFAVIGIFKSRRLLIGLLILFALSFLVSPNVRARIIGAVTVDDTAKARIESWTTAIKIFEKNPLFGVGFNTYRYTQAKYGYFSIDNPFGGHSGAGSDSSFLTVLATSGIFGTLFFLGFILVSVRNSLRFVKTSYIQLAVSSSLAATLIHSQFVNSMFFPQTMLILFFMLALGEINDN